MSSAGLSKNTGTTDRTMADALARLGVKPDTLSASEKAALDRDGYLIIENVLSPQQVAAMLARLEALASIEGENAGKDFQVEAGTVRLGSLINKGEEFDVCFLHPKMLAALFHVMGHDFGLSSITSRAAKPGEGHQAFHRDTQHPVAANALWLLTPFTADNGPTRVVPGSHHKGVNPGDAMADISAKHADEKYVIAPAGSLVIVHGHLWHSGTRNNTDQPRHLISAFWTPRGLYQPEAQRKLTPEAHKRLSAAALHVIDCELPGK